MNTNHVRPRLATHAVALALILFAAASANAVDHIGAIAADETWSAIDSPHVVVGNVTVNAGVTLTIEPGAEVQFDASRLLSIAGNLSAIGAPGQEILFTRSGASGWNYIRFQGAGIGTLEHCLIEHATYGIYSSTSGNVDASNVTFQNSTYGIYCSGTGALSVVDCQFLDNTYGISMAAGSIEMGSTTFSNNATYGFHGTGIAPTVLDADLVFSGNGTAVRIDDVPALSLTTPMTITGSTTAGIYLESCESPTLDNLVLTGNTGTDGALRLYDCGEFTLGAGNTIGGSGLENSWALSIGAGAYPSPASTIPTVGNTNNDIRVAGGSSARSGTWRKLADLDYIIAGSPTIAAGGELTIEPGVNVKFDSSRLLSIAGTLTAVGLPGQEITFTRNGASGWNYIRFQGAGIGTLEHCLIEHATYCIYGSTSGNVDIANATLQNSTYGIYSSSTGTLTVADCQIQDNSHGISIFGGPVDLSSTTFSNNTTYGFRGTGIAPNVLDGNVVFTGNGTGIRIDDVPALSLTTPMTVTGSTTAGIYLESCESPTLDNLVLTGNTGPDGALHLYDCGELTLGASNTIGGNGLENSWALSIGAGTYPTVAAAIPTVGNTNNDIRVAGGSSARSGTWRKFTDLDYIIAGSPTIAAGGGLTIEPGVNVRFDSSRLLTIAGTLTAIGLPGQEITFTRNGASNWNYIRVNTAGVGTLEHCLIEHATYGIYASTSGNVSATNVTFQNSTYGIYTSGTGAMTVADCQIQDNSYGISITNGSVALSSTTISNNTTYGFQGSGIAPTVLDANVVFSGNGTGIRIDDVPALSLTTPMTVTGSTTAGIYLESCESPTLDNLVLTGNTGTDGALHLYDCGEFTLGAGNTIGGNGLENSWPLSISAGAYPSLAGTIPTVGNTNNDIRVAGGSSARSGTWPKLTDLDYIIAGSPTIAAGGELTIEPGVNLRINSARVLSIAGTLTAIGLPGQEILFTRSGASNWNYIRFQTAGTGTLEHCIIEHATYGIYASTSGNVDVSNVTLQNNTYGIYTSTGTISLLNTRIIDNTSYGIYIDGGEMQFGTDISEWNDIYDNGNGTSGRQLYNGPNDLDAFYVYWGTMYWGDIREGIYDQEDDPARGFVTYWPYVNATHDGMVTGVDDEGGSGGEILPRTTVVHQNHPNPFNPTTAIRFDLKEAGPVRLEIFDVAGARVRTLIDETVAAGQHHVDWRGDDDAGRSMASGVYLYRFQAGEVNTVRRMMLVR